MVTSPIRRAGVIVGAQVVARSAETGVERSGRTNETGYFQMSFLPIGSYEVTVEATGFSTVVAKDSLVTLN